MAGPVIGPSNHPTISQRQENDAAVLLSVLAQSVRKIMKF
jgi:hypothetical protein